MVVKKKTLKQKHQRLETCARNNRDLRDRRDEAGLKRIEVWIIKKFEPEIRAKFKDIISRYNRRSGDDNMDRR